MKKLLTAFVLAFICSLGFAQAIPWAKSSEFYTNPDNSKAPAPVFVNSYSYTGPTAGGWVQIDLKPYGVAADAKAAFLSGLLIITHGTSQQVCDATVSLRAPGSGLQAANYLGQVVEAHVGGGQRSGFASWVPLVNGVFEFQWSRSTFGQWPQECSYGINLSLQAWTK